MQILLLDISLLIPMLFCISQLGPLHSTLNVNNKGQCFIKHFKWLEYNLVASPSIFLVAKYLVANQIAYGT